VHLVEVDPVGVEAAQAVLDRFHDPASGVAPVVGRVVHGVVELGGEHHLVPAALQGPPDDLLALAERVDVGSVDHVDTGVECGVHGPHALVVVGVAPGAEHHRAETEWADLDAGAAKSTVIHSTELPMARDQAPMWHGRSAKGRSLGWGHMEAPGKTDIASRHSL
jgi:hypothetical protein